MDTHHDNLEKLSNVLMGVSILILLGRLVIL